MGNVGKRPVAEGAADGIEERYELRLERGRPGIDPADQFSPERAEPRVEGTIGGDAADLLIGWDLVERSGQHGRVSDSAGGDLRSPDFECFLVNSDVDLAPDEPSMRHWFELNGERVWYHRACARYLRPRP